MKRTAKQQLRHLLFYAALLIMGTFVVEADIITGHHNAEHLRNAAVHYIEEPKEKEDGPDVSADTER